MEFGPKAICGIVVLDLIPYWHSTWNSALSHSTPQEPVGQASVGVPRFAKVAGPEEEHKHYNMQANLPHYVSAHEVYGL